MEFRFCLGAGCEAGAGCWALELVTAFIFVCLKSETVITTT